MRAFVEDKCGSIYPKGENSADFAKAKPSERVQSLLVNQKGFVKTEPFLL